jgi:hypothetical protein
MLNEASSLPALADFYCQRGDTWQQTIYLVQDINGLNFQNFDFQALSNDVKIDLTNVQVKLEIRKAGRYVRRITNNGIGGIITERGLIRLTLTAEQTQLLKPDKYQYELRLTLANGSQITYIKGYFRIIIDQDTLPEDILLVGSLEVCLFLTGQDFNTIRPPQTTTEHTVISGLTQTRMFFKSPNGDYYIQYIDNNGTIRYRRDNPTRYDSALVFLAPND